MNRVLFLLIFFALRINFAYSKLPNVKGRIIIFNSKFNSGSIKYLNNVTIEEEYGRSNPSVTKDDGFFLLELVKIEPGKSILITVKKDGYEVINEDKLKVVVDQEDEVRVYMALLSQIADSKRLYYNIGVTRGEAALLAKNEELNKQLNNLNRDAYKNKNKIQELQQALVQLAKEKSRLGENSMALADRFALTNFDEAGEKVFKAFKLFEQGNVSDALKILDIDALDKDIKTYSSASESGDKMIQKGIKLKADALRGKNQAIAGYMAGASMSLVEYNYDKAEIYFKRAIMNDSTNADNLLLYGDFLLRQKRIVESINIFKDAIIYSKTNHQKVTARVNLANLLRISQSNKCLIIYEDCIKMANSFDTKKSLYFKGVAFNGIGNYYFDDARNIDSAEVYFFKAINVKKNRLRLDSTSESYHEYLKSIENIVAVYAESKHCEPGEKYANEATIGYEKLCKLDSSQFIEYYGIILINYSTLLRRCSLHPDAINSCLKSIKFFQRLIKQNPDAYSMYLAMCYHNLGTVYDDLKNYEKSIQYSQLSYDIKIKYAKIYPEAYSGSLCGVSINICRSYYYGYIINNNAKKDKYLKKGITLMRSAKELLLSTKDAKESDINLRYLDQIDFWTKKFESLE